MIVHLFCRVNLPDCSIIGRVQSVALTDAVKAKVQSVCGVWVDHSSQFFRAMIRQKVFYSKSYTRLKSRNSYTVCYSEDGAEKYGVIQYFLSLSEQTVAVITPLIITASPTCYPRELSVLCSRINPVVLDTVICVVPVNNIVCKCVFIDTGSAFYVARKPSQLNLD